MATPRSQAERARLRRQQDAAHRDDSSYQRLRRNSAYDFLLDHQGANDMHEGRWQPTQPPRPTDGPAPQGFQRVVDMALQPGALTQDPAMSRAMFLRDIQHTERINQGLPVQAGANPNQYMIDALLRDNAIAQFDRDAPRLREEQARARPARS